MQQLADPAFIPWLLAIGASLAVLAVAGVIATTYAIMLKRRLAGEIQAARIEAATLNAMQAGSEKTVAELEKRNALLERDLMTESLARAGLEATEKERREQAELLARNEARLREAFAALSAEALGKNSRMFLDLAKAQLGEFNKGAASELEERRAAVDRLVKPIGEQLGKMDATLKEAEKSRTTAFGELMTLHGELQRETNLLTRALRHSSARGHWGELQLRRVVEMAGMVEHCDFDTQVSAQDREGGRLRPDLVVRLAGGRSIVVDAKAPMENYLKSQEAGDRSIEQEYLARHARDVRTHMTELGGKIYWEAFADAPEFVVMFFPSENVFADALKADADLVDFGAANGVIPASPVTLIALLRAAAYGWRQEKAAENAKLIFELGCELHDRFAKEYLHLAGLGAALSKAAESFNKTVGSAERMLFPTLRKFSSLLGRDIFPEPVVIEEEPRRLSGEGEDAGKGEGGHPRE